ncbi:MAG: hypothetical protein D6772_13950 [Bacteroidetes bacterium]|nr:MAG: hypothetical protein D6772_13950 [Bacteroidota bacterium]
MTVFAIPRYMDVQKIHCYHLRIPLRLTFGQANQSTRSSDSIVLHLETTQGEIGYGECGPRTYVSGENALRVRKTLAQLADLIYSQHFAKVSDIQGFVLGLLDEGYGPAAVCALELALLDAWGKVHQQSLWKAFGVNDRNVMPYSGIVPYGKWEKLEPLLKRFRFRQWKFKARTDWHFNAQRIEQLRSLPGMNSAVDSPDGHPAIRLDANGAWSLAQAQHNIEQALAQEVNSFEQAVAVEQEAAARSLTATYGQQARMIADEALVTLQDAQRIIAHKSYNHFNLKLSKNGGIFNALRIANLAHQHGIPCQLGAQYGETSLLSAAGVLFADMLPELTAREGALGTYLLQDDLTATPLMVDKYGKLPKPPTGYGLGVEVDELRLKQYSV